MTDDAANPTLQLASHSTAHTVRLGQAMAELAPPRLLVALNGHLGGGKTQLAKGLAKGLGVPEWERVNSPTFTLLRSYRGTTRRLHHMDLYRLGEGEDIPQECLEALDDPAGLCAVEWAGLRPEMMRDPTVLVEIAMPLDDDSPEASGQREIILVLDGAGGSESGGPPLDAGWLRAVAARYQALCETP